MKRELKVKTTYCGFPTIPVEWWLAHHATELEEKAVIHSFDADNDFLLVATMEGRPEAVIICDYETLSVFLASRWAKRWFIVKKDIVKELWDADFPAESKALLKVA